MVTWTEHAIFWHVYPLGFVGAPKSAAPEGQPVAHRLERLHGWLEYATDLGCSALVLGPIFASESHGYDTVDYFRIDPRLGDDADFDALVAEADRRGLRVVLDGVFNHVGRTFPRFVEADADPTSDAARWFRRSGEGWWTFEGNDPLVSLNHEAPEVLEHVVAVMRHWLDRGAAGWRLDAAYAVPTSFWRRALDQVRQTHPDAWFVAEVIHGDFPAFVAESGVDSITQYELWKSIWSSLNDGNFFELSWNLKRHNTFLDAFVPYTFVGNHDVSRIGSQLSEPRHLPLALAALFTLGGMPAVYEGDEQAFTGIKEERAGGDDAVRPEFPATPAGLLPYGWPTYALHQRLIGLRRRHAWLVRARSEELQVTNTALAYRCADPDDPAGRVVVLLNAAPDPVTFDVDLGGLELLESSDPADADLATLAPFGWRILGGA